MRSRSFADHLQLVLPLIMLFACAQSRPLTSANSTAGAGDPMAVSAIESQDGVEHRQQDAGASLPDDASVEGDGGPGAGSVPDKAEDERLETEDAPVPRCEPKADGSYSVLEGETIEIQLRCSLALEAPRLFAVDEAPVGLTLDATGALSWTPSLAQAGMYEMTFQEKVSGETGVVRLHVVDRWDAPENVPVADAMKYHEEFGLPVIHLYTDPTINDDAHTPAEVVYRGYKYHGVQAKTRGAMSRAYPKRSFTLKFAKEDKFNEPNLAGGFLEKRKVTLTSTFDDNSYLRQRLGYELWNRIDPSHVMIQSYSAVVFLNGVYHGLYYLTDHVDGFLMEDFGHWQDGDLYKARTHDANFRSHLHGVDTPKRWLYEGYSKEEGFPLHAEPGAFDNLVTFISWVINTPPDVLAIEAPSRIALREYQDWWIWVSFIAADDSAGKNSYHYRDPTSDENLWHVVPWDLNQSFGQDWYTLRTPPDMTTPEDYYLERNQLFEKLLAGPLGADMRKRYAEVLRNGPYDLEQVLTRLDEIAAEVRDSALRDEAKWLDARLSFEFFPPREDYLLHEDEVKYVRQWIIDRHAFLTRFYGPGQGVAP